MELTTPSARSRDVWADPSRRRRSTVDTGCSAGVEAYAVPRRASRRRLGLLACRPSKQPRLGGAIWGPRPRPDARGAAFFISCIYTSTGTFFEFCVRACSARQCPSLCPPCLHVCCCVPRPLVRGYVSACPDGAPSYLPQYSFTTTRDCEPA
eukprot:3073772-Prymnesium_polylepis.2